MRRATLTIEGMTCDGCVRSVERVLGTMPGVVARRVELGRARVDFDEAVLEERRLREAVEEAGYDVSSVAYDGEKGTA